MATLIGSRDKAVLIPTVYKCGAAIPEDLRDENG
jgi:hypothetical protein